MYSRMQWGKHTHTAGIYNVRGEHANIVSPKNLICAEDDVIPFRDNS